MASVSGANRFELESQILSAALRQSWADTDAVGVVKASRELYQIFPDLLPSPPESEHAPFPENYYALLSVECDVNPSMVNAAYLKKVKQFLREHPNPKEAKEEYYSILNAGYILRKPRLRLSHDLLVCKAWLDEHQIDPDEVEAHDSELRDFTPPPSVVPEADGVASVESVPSQWRTAEKRLPMLIDLLKACQIIGPAEVQALKNQMLLYTDVSLVDLVLQAGYVTDLEMKSLNLAEYLLVSGKITMGQFSQAMIEEIDTGRRMSDTLLYGPDRRPSGESPPPPGDEELPPPRARVPRKPRPSGGASHLKLVPPRPLEPGPDAPGV